MSPTDSQKRAKERSDDLVDMALMRQDMKYMREDISEIKEELRRSAGTYLTREQAILIQAEWNEKFSAQTKRINAIYTYGGSILALLTAALVGAVLKLILKV